MIQLSIVIILTFLMFYYFIKKKNFGFLLIALFFLVQVSIPLVSLEHFRLQLLFVQVILLLLGSIIIIEIPSNN